MRDGSLITQSTPINTSIYNLVDKLTKSDIFYPDDTLS